MICYRDMTFCDRGVDPNCSRKLTPEIRASAQRWWGGPDAPIAQFSGWCPCDRKPEETPDAG